MIETAIDGVVLAGIATALLLLKRHRRELEAAGWYNE